MTQAHATGILSLAKIHAIALGFLGLVCGILYSFGGLAIDALVTLDLITTTETPGLSFGTVLAFGALIGMPVIFSGVGFVVGVVVGALYTCADWILQRCGLQ